jgi:protein TonB
MSLADEDQEPLSLGQRLAKVTGVVLVLLVVGVLAWWLKGVLSAPAEPKRQMARITILPDKPPPPPPPPREEPKPTPRQDDKPPPPDVAPKPQPATPAANEPLKMEGAAGTGDSPFAAGTVRNEYQGGKPAIGASAPAGGSPSVVDRAQQRLYAQSARQLLQTEIERALRGDAVELVVSFALWVDAGGAIQRAEVLPSGNAQHDTDLRAALEDTRRTLKLPQPPAAMDQPMRFRLTVRPQG